MNDQSALANIRRLTVIAAHIMPRAGRQGKGKTSDSLDWRLTITPGFQVLLRTSWLFQNSDSSSFPPASA